MALIDLFEIKKQYDIKLLLDHVDFHLNEGERIAVVGQNGCGKSTLMKIALGTEEPTEGKRVVANTLQVEMLAQQPRFEPTLTVRDAILGELSELKAAQEEHARLSLEVADDFENKLLLEKLEAISTYLDHHNAWNLDDKIERILQEFKLKEYENRLVVSLSGGEQRRVALASLVLKKPDVLLLDEPTNHLDVYMVEFLEEILLKEKFTLLFISHDRHFIDTIATRVIEVENQGLVSYKGGYRDYLHQKEERMLSLAKSHDTLLKMLKREEEWLGKSVRAREKRNQGRKARVFELREQAKKNPTLIRKMQIELEREKKSWRGEKGLSKRKMLFDVEHLGYSIADKLLIKDFSTRILQRDKIAIVGINGAGKSTLLKLLLGRLSPNSGLIDKGEFSIGYFDQHREMLNDTHTLIETFCPNGGDHVDVQGAHMHVYAYLKTFLFPQEYMTKKIGQLSGGEKNRVALALLFTKNVECLILDEPTNDLDIQTITILEDKLIAFQGALLFVSHDRYFIDKIASKLFIFKGEGLVEESYQSYTEYLEIEKEMQELDALEREVKSESKKTELQATKKQTKLSYKEQRDFDTLPDEIEALEEQIRALNACLADPECYQQKGLSTLSESLIACQKEYEEKSDRYLEILEIVESL
ncbi:MAG TPA: ABC-F family ATP-binding cassette domain-containing protein [Sulfurovum sp.]|nr:MAG: ABC transporter ATP-binding protein [Sulfurovum sp. 35-42-20]OYZ24865.1 MAG: ABC transporter ATP-binding protein [Sulfurovum sp. 16-42-52]OYZ50352.1 MAG: ABC transporter ATP-binding protein [Sulfurovum sp. 24-42-9]OZA44579.1 MAG: ABC transporter ATP-binding protein [Sulfurovum sp. 17-42-90]OZA60789.1 MAG: ABC transporter ATP-binding protein [Sulfurovum sp. 39-42-12]HQR74524.1 ABC-F family ATP-binding cassette domain-containing protein [Sulfurovum sp.]